jgi:hypothetical protein
MQKTTRVVRINYLGKKWREENRSQQHKTTANKKNKTQTNSNKYKEIPTPTTISPFQQLKKTPTTYKGRNSPLQHQY